MLDVLKDRKKPPAEKVIFDDGDSDLFDTKARNVDLLLTVPLTEKRGFEKQS